METEGLSARKELFKIRDLIIHVVKTLLTRKKRSALIGMNIDSDPRIIPLYETSVIT